MRIRGSARRVFAVMAAVFGILALQSPRPVRALEILSPGDVTVSSINVPPGEDVLIKVGGTFTVTGTGNSQGTINIPGATPINPGSSTPFPGPVVTTVPQPTFQLIHQIEIPSIVPQTNNIQPTAATAPVTTPATISLLSTLNTASAASNAANIAASISNPVNPLDQLGTINSFIHTAVNQQVSTQLKESLFDSFHLDKAQKDYENRNIAKTYKDSLVPVSHVVPGLMSSILPKIELTEKSDILVAHHTVDTDFAEVTPDTYVLNAGEVVINSRQDVRVKACDHIVSLKAGTSALLSLEGDILRVINAHDESRSKSVKVIALGKKEMEVLVGEELVVGSDPVDVSDAVSQFEIGRRRNRVFSAGNGIHVHRAEVSLVGLMGQHRLLSHMRHSAHKLDKYFTNKLMKTAASLTVITSHHGHYSL